MKVEKIIFFQTFPTGSFQNQKLGIEIVLEENDFLAENDTPFYEPRNSDIVIKKAFAEAKKMVNDAFKAMNPEISEDQFRGSTMMPLNESHPSVRPIPEVQVDKTANREDSIINELNKSKTEEELFSYRFVKEHHPRIKTAFFAKLAELQSLQNKQ